MQTLMLTLLVCVVVTTATFVPGLDRGSYYARGLPGSQGFNRDQQREYGRETSGDKVLDINISEQERNRDREFIRDRDQRGGFQNGGLPNVGFPNGGFQNGGFQNGGFGGAPNVGNFVLGRRP